MSIKNSVRLIGNLGRDPETKYTAAGTAICNVSIAISETYKDKNGERQEKTEWVRLAAFGKTAETMGEYLRKGSKIAVEGRLQTREWEKEGVKQYMTEVVVDQFAFLDSKRDDDNEERPARSSKPAKPAKPQVDLDDDIPF